MEEVVATDSVAATVSVVTGVGGMDSAAAEAEVEVAILRLTRLAIPSADSSAVTTSSPKALGC